MHFRQASGALIRLAALLLAVCIGGCAHAQSDFQLPLKIGGGGWNTGVDVCTDGTRYVRTDSYGAYVWDGVSRWSQLFTRDRIPSPYFGYFPTGGSRQINQARAGRGGPAAYEIASAPSDCNIVYMMSLGGIFKSINKGKTFPRTTFGGGTAVVMAPNGVDRTSGRKMAVDPINSDVVFAGSDELGMFVTRDGGASWDSIPGVPASIRTANYKIAFDPSSAPIACPTGKGSCTGTIYAHSTGPAGGVYVSTDGGLNWSLTVGGPTYVQHMIVSRAGVVWAVDGAANSNGFVWAYTGSWRRFTSFNAPRNAHSVAADPANPGRIVVGSTGGNLNITSDAGMTWSGNTTISRSASLPHPPWLAAVNEMSMSNGDMVFDPSLPNTLLFGEGIGPWITNPKAGTTVWTSIANGIEQLVSRQVIAPNGVAVVGVSDRSLFYLPNPQAYPSNYNAPYNDSFSLGTTLGIDYAADNPSFMASITADITGAFPNTINSATSTDGGRTWQQFCSYCEDIAASALGGSRGTGGLIRIKVPSTKGLVAWTPGTTARNSIVRLLNYGGSPNTARGYYEIANITPTTFDLLNSSFGPALAAAGRYKLYVDTNPLSDIDGLYYITGTANDGGMVRVVVFSTGSSISNNTIVCIRGVEGTVEANGCWTTTNQDNRTNSFSLLGSQFANPWIRGGTVNRLVPPGGSIAVASTSNIVYVPGNLDYPQCTLDGGLTWTQIRLPGGIPPSGDTGWVHNVNLNRHIAAADRVVPNTIYLYNAASNSNTYRLYTVKDCSAFLTGTGTIGNSNFNATMLSVPGHAGHLLFAIGNQGVADSLHPGGGPLRWSRNGGSTWNSITSTAEPISIGVGAIAPGSDYPTIYLVGWVNNVYGIWRSTSTAAQWTANNVSWTKVNDYPLGSMDNVTTITGDGKVWNKWYLGWSGSSFTYGQQN